ncbi:MAG TPA: peptidylprolyl isomerase [Deltaproteobacteria bacterium]|nr:peptidylprolyl isomerase [Deltaproteobacteria bacterium]
MNTFTKALCGILYGIVWVTLAASVVSAETQKGGEAMTIATGKTVSIEYTLTLENKEVIDTNRGSDPLTYVQGSSQIIPGLENAMDGMKVGETKQVEVEPEDGYGPVFQDAIVEVNRDQLPEGACEVDAQLQAQGPDGQILRGKVTKIENDKAFVDFNHPLAGKKLFFDVKVLDIK